VLSILSFLSRIPEFHGRHALEDSKEKISKLKLTGIGVTIEHGPYIHYLAPELLEFDSENNKGCLGTLYIFSVSI